MNILQMPYLGDPFQGRFGNQMFSYLFLLIAKCELGVQVRTPPWEGQHIFGIDQQGPLMPSNIEISFSPKFIISPRTTHVYNSTRCAPGLQRDLQVVRSFLNRSDSVINILGFFQYQTAQLLPYRSEIMKAYAISEVVESLKASYMDVLGISDRMLICVHIRRGDYLLYGPRHDIFWGCSVDSVAAIVRDFQITAPHSPVIYVCTDDIAYCEQEFGRRNIPFLTAKSASIPLSPSQELQLDFGMMRDCDVLIASNSSLSVFASLLNLRGRVFLRPEQHGGELIPYDPWNTHVLLSRSGNYDF